MFSRRMSTCQGTASAIATATIGMKETMHLHWATQAYNQTKINVFTVYFPLLYFNLFLHNIFVKSHKPSSNQLTMEWTYRISYTLVMFFPILKGALHNFYLHIHYLQYNISLHMWIEWFLTVHVIFLFFSYLYGPVTLLYWIWSWNEYITSRSIWLTEVDLMLCQVLSWMCPTLTDEKRVPWDHSCLVLNIKWWTVIQNKIYFIATFSRSRFRLIT